MFPFEISVKIMFSLVVRERLPELIVATNWLPVNADALRGGRLNVCENAEKIVIKEKLRSKIFFIDQI
jgi:hypothetical protein